MSREAIPNGAVWPSPFGDDLGWPGGDRHLCSAASRDIFPQARETGFLAFPGANRMENSSLAIESYQGKPPV